MPDAPAPRTDDVAHSLPTAKSVRLGLLLALVGGGLDAYTFISRGGAFANAQTGNIVLMAIAFAQVRWWQGLNHIPSVIAFIAGLLAAESLKRPKCSARVRKPARAALVLETGVLVVVGFIPRTAPDSLATILVAFTSSLQVATFRTLVDTPYTSTTTTGNLRTAAQNAYLALIDHDIAAARRARHFGVIILAFGWAKPA